MRIEETDQGSGDQPLSDHRPQALRKVRANLGLFFGREDFDHAVDGPGGAGGMQCGQDEVPGFRSLQRGPNGLQIAQFADQDYVGILSEHVFES